MDERKKEDLSVQDVEVVPVKKKRKKISISMILCVVFLITTGIFWSVKKIQSHMQRYKNNMIN